MRLIAVTLLALMLMPSPAGASDASLDEIVELAQGGAPGLALRLLDQEQPSVEDDAQAWARYERERLHILSVRGQWKSLDERVDLMPEEAPVGFRAWALQQQAHARLERDDGPGARAILRSLVWQQDPLENGGFGNWRRLIIRSYLVEDRLPEALTALQRYVQDYGHDSLSLRALHAEVLLRVERAQEAFALLRNEEDASILGLRWLAALRSGEAQPAETFEQMVRRGSDRDASPLVRKAAWRVAAEAARNLDNQAAYVASLERTLMTDPGNDSLPRVLETEAPALWAAYRAWGRSLGNTMRLIVGIDQPWLDAAEASDEPLRARALYAALAADTRTPAVREFAHYRFTRLLLDETGGERVLAALYLDPRVYDEPAQIPARVRYALLEPVLARGEIELASRLVADLDQPPADSDPVEWTLRRARVLILGARPESGARVLNDLFDRLGGEMDTGEVDRFLQVVFDLQAVESHRAALDLFDRVQSMQGIQAQKRRELLYWMADSWRALDRPAEAARLYLRSATLHDPFSMDPWAQTARFQAAESLIEAGLLDDAAVLLRGLLNATDDPARRSVLRHRIDQLQRLEGRVR